MAPVRVVLSRTIIAYYDPIRPSRRHGATSRGHRLYATPSLCGSAEATRETFPPFPAVLSLRAIDPTPVGPPPHSRFLGAGDNRLPRVRTESPPTFPPLPAIPGGGLSRRCIVRFMLRPAGLPRPPGWLRRGECTHSPCLLRTFVTLALVPRPHGRGMRVRLDGRTGNLPSSGLPPD